LPSRVRRARAASHRVERGRLALEGIAGRLHALSPQATIARGYAVLTDDKGAPVTSVTALEPGDAFVARVRDGRIHARTERTERLEEVSE
jgi:exodeoxyribonuclease VII large subunit